MPIEVRGLVEIRKAIRQLSPDIDKQLSKDVRAVLKPIVKTARSYATPNLPGLSHWTYGGKAKAINAHTSMFRPDNSKKGRFPEYNAATVRAGIRYSIRQSRPNRKGWSSAYRIWNASAAGAIFETAGRVNFGGRSGSHSPNPNAGYHFNLALNTQSELVGAGKLRGRLIYRAWAQDQTKATNAVLHAINIAKINFARTTNGAALIKRNRLLRMNIAA